jgi:Mn2+/Fe2+ NRAMP family transporter
MGEKPQSKGIFKFWRSLGPAIITASVVLGPGSILAASKIGYKHGYTMSWVVAFASLMMIGMMALSARLGVVLKGTLCDELARRDGRWVAVVTGVSLFLIAACFQFGNNLGVLMAVEPFLPEEDPEATGFSLVSAIKIAVIVGLNVVVIVALVGFKKIYKPIELLMKLMVTLMMIAFAANIVMAQPDLFELVAGLVPRLPEGAANTLFPQIEQALVIGDVVAVPATMTDNLTPVIALFATTFSVAGAFYQSYLVRKKGWTLLNVREGLFDTVVGVAILGSVSLMIMVTAAAVLHGNDDVGELGSAADVARQLSPLFAGWATILFCMGIFAGAFSSFLVNAMIGGTMLSDGLGLGGDIDQRWPKVFTVVGLMIGMGVAIYVEATGIGKPVNLLIFAQAMTVLGLPALAIAMFRLATLSDLTGDNAVPWILKFVALVAVVIVIFLAVRTCIVLYFNLFMAT